MALLPHNSQIQCTGTICSIQEVGLSHRDGSIVSWCFPWVFQTSTIDTFDTNNMSNHPICAFQHARNARCDASAHHEQEHGARCLTTKAVMKTFTLGINTYSSAYLSGALRTASWPGSAEEECDWRMAGLTAWWVAVRGMLPAVEVRCLLAAPQSMIEFMSCTQYGMSEAGLSLA